MSNNFRVRNLYAENLNLTNRPFVNGSGLLLNGDQSIVYTTGNQNISGIKTFAESISASSASISGTLNVAGNTTLVGTTVATGKITANGQGSLNALGDKDVMTRSLTDQLLIDPNIIYFRDEFLGLFDGQNPFGTMAWAWTPPIGTGNIRPQGNTSTLNTGVVGLVTTAVYRASVIARGDTSNTVGGGGFDIAYFHNSHTSLKFRFSISSLNSTVRLGMGTYSDVFRASRHLGIYYNPVGTTWTANNTVTLNEWRIPTVANGRRYYASTAGTTHASIEPTWPTTSAGTVSDGTVVWTEGGKRGNPNLQFGTYISTNEAIGSFTDTGVVAAANTWYEVSMRWVSGSTWAMSINGGAEVQVTHSMSGAASVFAFGIENTDNVANQLNVDYFNLFSRITRP